MGHKGWKRSTKDDISPSPTPNLYHPDHPPSNNSSDMMDSHQNQQQQPPPPTQDVTTKYAPPILDPNAPDLYIPLMSFVSYLIITGLGLGLEGI